MEMNLTAIIPNLILKMERSLNCASNLENLRSCSFVDEMSNQSSDPKASFVGLSSFAHKRV